MLILSSPTSFVNNDNLSYTHSPCDLRYVINHYSTYSELLTSIKMIKIKEIYSPDHLNTNTKYTRASVSNISSAQRPSV